MDAGLALTLAIEWAHLGKVGLMMVFVFACVLLILTVLIQRPQGGGLAGAFGSGAGSGQTAFGAKTGDALTVATIIMFVFYLLTAIGLSYAVRPGAATVTAPVTVPAETPATPQGSTNAVAPETAPATSTEPAPAPAPAPTPAQPAPADPAPAQPQPAPAEPSTPGPKN